MAAEAVDTPPVTASAAIVAVASAAANGLRIFIATPFISFLGRGRRCPKQFVGWSGIVFHDVSSSSRDWRVPDEGKWEEVPPTEGGRHGLFQPVIAMMERLGGWSNRSDECCAVSVAVLHVDGHAGADEQQADDGEQGDARATGERQLADALVVLHLVTGDFIRTIGRALVVVAVDEIGLVEVHGLAVLDGHLERDLRGGKDNRSGPGSPRRCRCRRRDRCR